MEALTGTMDQNRSETDWARLLPEVARRLLGDPPRTERSGATCRYRTHGSLAVHVGGDRAGTWRDFEAGKSGGTLDLVQHVLQCDKAAALRWLEDEGLIERRSEHGDGLYRAQAPAPVLRAIPRPPQPSKTAPLAAAILRDAVPADDTPARTYLSRRRTWPPNGIGPDLPTTVRYIDVGVMPEGRREDGTSYRLLPAAAAGCVVFVLTDPAGRLPPAASLEAVTAKGHRLDWCDLKRWRRTFGSKTGLVFEARNVPGGHLWLVEGECDALALALCGHGGCVRSGVGAEGMRLEAVTDLERRPVVIVADGDAPGAGAASRLRAKLSEVSDRGCEVHYLSDGDIADALAYWVAERAGIRGDGDPEADAVWTEITVWDEDILTAIERGGRLIDPEVR